MPFKTSSYWVPIVLALALCACSGGSGGGSGGSGGGSSPPPPAIAVSVSPSTATVPTGSMIRVTGTVSNDASNSGVSWTLSCSVAQCGSISPTTTPSGVATVYTAPATIAANANANVNITLTATSIADKSKVSSATLIPVGYIPGYDVGVDYHAYGTDFDSTAFITIYNQPQVRQTVQSQLQGIADRGATYIQTAIWFVTGPDDSDQGQTWRAHFPLSSQEATNLRTYAEDVAVIQGASGNRLRLSLGFAWLGAADYTIGSPTTTLGYDNLTAAQYTANVQASIDSVLAAISGVNRPDGVPVVNSILFDGSVAFGNPVGNTPNIEWFLLTFYPYFVSRTQQQGFTPTFEFGADGMQADVLDNNWTDPNYPILNNHRSMFWTYREINFFVTNGLPLPARIDIDCYLVSTGASYDQLLQRILDDADATLPSLGAPSSYGCVEAYYLTDPTQRLLYGQAYAMQAAQSPRLQRVSFWTTPDGGGTGQEEAYPFTIEDFLPPPPTP
jgi:hypothetical protein